MRVLIAHKAAVSEDTTISFHMQRNSLTYPAGRVNERDILDGDIGAGNQTGVGSKGRHLRTVAVQLSGVWVDDQLCTRGHCAITGA